MNTIGERLRQARKNKDLSMAKLEKISGITSGNISEIENGKILPSTKAIIALCEALDITPNWLLLGKEDIQNKENPMSFSEFEKKVKEKAETTKLSKEEFEKILLKTVEIYKIMNQK